MGQHHAFFLVLLLSGCSFAGPVRDVAAEGPETTENDVCIVKNVTFARGDVVPDVAPCETCVCEPPEVKCSMVKCHHNNGCKIIQQSGKCCPVYKCDCEHEGKTYNNGEKLDNPVSPCQVCYCRGGEIMCNSITCYRRDDCEPQIIEGQCCPKYGHCPSKNSSSVVAVPADPTGLSTKREMQPWLLTKSVNVPMAETPKYPQTIKIVEILPTQAPVKSGEVSLVPRIITNGSPDKLASSSEPPTDNPSSTETSAQPLMMSPEPSTSGVDEVVQPHSETFSTILPQMIDATTEYEELAALFGEATEGTGYDIESGGTFFPKTTKEEEEASKEESHEGSGESSEGDITTTASSSKTTSDLLAEREFLEHEVADELNTGNQTMSANMEVEVTEKDENLTTVTDIPSSTHQSSETETLDSSEEGTRGPDGLITRHGLTIPPILNLNHQLHHLTLGGTGDGREETSMVRIGVYDPTKPGEMSNMVTVIKNEDTVPSSSSDDTATTQVLLTPEDLKTLAEMIIKEKIKAPNEDLKLGTSGTTPLPTEIYEETSAGSSVLVETKENATSTTADEKIEETTMASPKSERKIQNLTKEEEKAQAVLDKLTSNIHIPLQGIELVDMNDTTTANPDVDVLPSKETSEPENKDAEWVDISNSTEKANRVEDEASTDSDATETVDGITMEDNRATTGDAAESTTLSASEESTTNAMPGKQRGSLRQMENRPLNSQELGDRRTRITASNDPSKIVSTAMLDENDKLLVENFFKKALDFQ